MPKYLFGEQYSKCIESFEKLYYWTEDVFYHQMSAFHEVALYRFIDYMADLREEIEQFDSIYFDETNHTLIKTIAQQEYKSGDVVGINCVRHVFIPPVMNARQTGCYCYYNAPGFLCHQVVA